MKMSSSSSSLIVLRIRTQLGTWRLNDVKLNDNLNTLRKRVESEHRTDLQGLPFTLDAKGLNALDDSLTVQQVKLNNGDFLYAMVDETKTGVHEAATAGRRITKEGNIVAQEYSSLADQKGFRPGMMPLRNMKMQWTLQDFIDLDEQFQYKMVDQKKKKAVCSQVSVDFSCITEFQSYVLQYDYRQMRIGYLYGTFEEDNKVNVELIYEPPQETTDISFEILDDPNEVRVNLLAEMLGLKKVGWIFAHPTREKGFQFSGPEIIAAAEQQLIAAQGIEDTPFITLKAYFDIELNQPTVEAYQVTKQTMEMVAEGVLGVSKNLGCCSVHPTFTVVVEHKSVKEVDNNFFLVLVPIVQHAQEIQQAKFLCTFPKLNRLGVKACNTDLQRQIIKAGTQGWTYQSLIADFQLLLFLCDYLSLEDDIPKLINSVLNPEIPLGDGHLLYIRSIAGLD